MEHLFLFSILLYSLPSLFFYRKIRDKACITPFIPLVIGAVQGIAQLFQASKQRKEADKAAKYIPPALLEEENLARTQAGATRYAGQAQDEANVRQGVADTFANVSRASTSSGEVLNAASKLHGAQSQAMQGIAQRGQIFRQNALDRLRGTLARKAGAQMQARMYAENLRGAASRNQYNALNSAAGGVVAGGLANDWNKTFGKNTNPTQSPLFNPMLPQGMNANPMLLSTYGWNPMAFSAGGNFSGR